VRAPLLPRQSGYSQILHPPARPVGIQYLPYPDPCGSELARDDASPDTSLTTRICVKPNTEPKAAQCGSEPARDENDTVPEQNKPPASQVVSSLQTLYAGRSGAPASSVPRSTNLRTAATPLFSSFGLSAPHQEPKLIFKITPNPPEADSTCTSAKSKAKQQDETTKRVLDHYLLPSRKNLKTPPNRDSYTPS
jgi:hypothetical protein